jgi:hypothetical protein
MLKGTDHKCDTSFRVLLHLKTDFFQFKGSHPISVFVTQVQFNPMYISLWVGLFMANPFLFHGIWTKKIVLEASKLRWHLHCQG